MRLGKRLMSIFPMKQNISSLSQSHKRVDNGLLLGSLYEVSLPSWIGRKLRKARGTMFSIGLIFLIAYIAWKYRNIL